MNWTLGVIIIATAIAEVALGVIPLFIQKRRGQKVLWFSILSSTLVNKMRGKILLQVESRGEAWYVSPDDGKRYYMKDGDAAYQIMRFLSLGIKNSDLERITVGE